MASRIMHLAIANQICKEFPELYKRYFLLGNLLPDSNSVYGHGISDKERAELKALSHFSAKKERNEIVQPEEFFKKYEKRMNSSFMIGYFIHLISDKIWLKNINAKYIDNLEGKERQETVDKYYRDMAKLNTFLIQRYNLVALKGKVKDNPKIKVKEVGAGREILLKDLLKDYESDNVHLELELLNLEEIYGFINEAVEKSAEAIKELGIDKKINERYSKTKEKNMKER